MTTSRILPVLLITLLACGCSDDQGPELQPKDVSGYVIKGPVGGASVEIRTIGPDGRPDALVAGPVQTAANGSWSATIPDGQDKRLLVVARGGEYTDEATEATVELTSEQELVGYLNTAVADIAIVTPLTHAIHLGAARLIGDQDMGVGAAWDARCEAFEDLAFDPLTTVPGAAGSAAEERYAAFLAGFCTLAQDPQLAGLGGNAFDVVAALSEDLSDGKLDARGPAGSEVLVGGEPLPAMDAAGVTALVDAAEEAAGTDDLWGTVIIDPLVVDCPTLLAVAHDELEDVLYEEINADEPDRPADIDFRRPRDLYEEVLACDPDNIEAHFALSLLELAVLSADAEVNQAFDEWKAYLDEAVPFETDPPTMSRFGRFGLADGSEIFSLPTEVVKGSVLGLLRLGRFEDEVPQISGLQAILQAKVIPAVTRAIDHLDEVIEQAPTYEFTITPKMQGDLDEESLQADRTDFLATRGALCGLRAACRVAIAYEASMPQYDEANVYAALDQETGTWLRLRPGGGAQMEAVPADLLAAADHLDQAISALFAEIDAGDNQDDEIIKIGPDLPSRADIEEFQDDELPRIRRSLAGPTQEVYDWDGDESTPEVSMTVNLRGFFIDPVQDFKALLPPYELSTETVPYEEDWTYREPVHEITVDVPETGYVYSTYCSRYYEDFELDYEYCDDEPVWLRDAIDEAIDLELAALQADPDWVGDLWCNAYFTGGMLQAGTHTIQIHVDLGYGLAETWVTIPVVTFEADTYQEWTAGFPDPTISGMFPEFTSAAELLDVFGMRANDWEKVVRIDWVD